MLHQNVPYTKPANLLDDIPKIAYDKRKAEYLRKGADSQYDSKTEENCTETGQMRT